MKIALALGGGAALGWAHIGALRVLEEAGIEIGAVAGTSIGAVVGTAFAAGELDALEAIARGTTRLGVIGYLDPFGGRGAFLGGRRILKMLGQHLGTRRIEDLPIPAACMAADLLTGEEVCIADGPVVDAVRASIALPSLFSPMRRHGALLIDGGMLGPIPIRAARALAPELPVVAIDLMGDFAGHIGRALPHGMGSRPSALTVGRASFLMIMLALTRQQIAIEKPDVVITPAIGHIGTGAFSRADELIELGQQATHAALPAIRQALSRSG